MRYRSLLRMDSIDFAGIGRKLGLMSWFVGRPSTPTKNSSAPKKLNGDLKLDIKCTETKLEPS